MSKTLIEMALSGHGNPVYTIGRYRVYCDNNGKIHDVRIIKADSRIYYINGGMLLGDAVSTALALNEWDPEGVEVTGQ